MTGDDLGEERDPLLVRPYLAGASGAVADETSPQTWPAAVPEARSRRAADCAAGVDGVDDPTAILTRPTKSARPARWPFRRRAVVLASVGGVVVLGVAAAGLAALRTGLVPAGPLALPDEPLPAVTGPQTSPPATAPGVVLVSPPARHDGSVPGSVPAAGSSAVPSAGSSFAGASPTVESGTTTLNPTTPSSAPALVAPAPPAGRTGTIRGQNGLCLDLAGSVAADTNLVMMADCSGTATQTWTLADDGTLQVAGKCALIAGDAAVHIAGCDGTGPALWKASGQLLINAADNRCLTDPSGGSIPATAVTVAVCSGSAKQRWSLP